MLQFFEQPPEAGREESSSTRRSEEKVELLNKRFNRSSALPLIVVDQHVAWVTVSVLPVSATVRLPASSCVCPFAGLPSLPRAQELSAALAADGRSFSAAQSHLTTTSHCVTAEEATSSAASLEQHAWPRNHSHRAAADTCPRW